jgi:hypothetical protein
VTALNCSDPQAQCFASAAISAQTSSERAAATHKLATALCFAMALCRFCAPTLLMQTGGHATCAGSLAVSKDDRVASSLAQQGMAPALQQMLQADSTVRTPVLQHLTHKLDFVTHMAGRPELIDQSNDCRARRKACGRVCGGAPCAASTPAPPPACSWRQHCSRLAWPPHSRCNPQPLGILLSQCAATCKTLSWPCGSCCKFLAVLLAGTVGRGALQVPGAAAAGTDGSSAPRCSHIAAIVADQMTDQQTCITCIVASCYRGPVGSDPGSSAALQWCSRAEMLQN